MTGNTTQCSCVQLCAMPLATHAGCQWQLQHTFRHCPAGNPGWQLNVQLCAAADHPCADIQLETHLRRDRSHNIFHQLTIKEERNSCSLGNRETTWRYCNGMKSNS